MNRFAFALSLGLAALSVQAQSEPAATTSASETAPETAPANSQDAIVVRSDASARPAPDTGCVRDTGTRLRKRDRNGCTGAPGDSYSRGEIDGTGATDVGEAIRKLSPSATLRRGR